MIRRFALCAVALAAMLCGSIAAAECNGAPEPCLLPDGSYHILLPEGVTGPRPAVLLLHGYGGEGEGFMRRDRIAGQFLERGYAVIAPDGQPRDDGKGRSWDFHPERPARRDEIAFLTAVADDAAAKYGLTREDMLLAGFSIGGSMTSYVACRSPAAFAAYAPVAGSFWRPHPAACAGPVRLLHTHGTADRTVPLAGRAITPEFVQGNVPEAMQIWRKANGCRSEAADQTESRGIYTIRRWTECAPGTDLIFALHGGGHSIPKGWAQMVLDWHEGRD
ncbi:polyhydroxybutyrate depolymerase [Tabrizicola sp. TH137]|uniref:alpha/beta hydrolase family esterase n=1 Tax=Tabrizicola sp. TH137 TaxID=2067452 RepID=UPI000C7DDFC6|nr:PHB depolymerase family esterase [Tabrizicola sp. TH137]PLL12506.1 polyhydroxybutyrate depolymerase [Tabrizicola sp. TH137]